MTFFDQNVERRSNGKRKRCVRFEKNERGNRELFEELRECSEAWCQSMYRSKCCIVRLRHCSNGNQVEDMECIEIKSSSAEALPAIITFKPDTAEPRAAARVASPHVITSQNDAKASE